MKHERLFKVLCTLFFLLCLTPLAVFLLFGPSKAGANERLPARPRLTASGSFNWDVLSDAADYFAGRFGLRQELISANAALQSALFHESAASDVILGSDGWLYYADTLPDYTGSAPMTERQLWCAAKNLALVQEYAASHGAAFLFVCAPNKNTLYPAQMPARYVRAEGTSDLDRLEALLRAQNVNFCDVRSVLTDSDALTYYRTDSHWNGYGSALAHDALMAALGREASLHTEKFTMQPHTGDLYQMLYPASSYQEEGLSLARTRSFRYDGEIHGADDQQIHTFSKNGGALLMFRDSFGNALHADLAEDFGEALFSRAMPYDLSLMEKVLPDTLLIELVERNLRWLSARAPLLPAPERTLPDCAAAPSGSFSVRESASGWENLALYQGTLDGVTPDDDSPVYAVLDGVCYEACPTDTGFQFIAPSGAELSVIVRSGGSYLRISSAS